MMSTRRLPSLPCRDARAAFAELRGRKAGGVVGRGANGVGRRVTPRAHLRDRLAVAASPLMDAPVAEAAVGRMLCVEIIINPRIRYPYRRRAGPYVYMVYSYITWGV